MANGHGGKRAGSGRKAKADKHAGKIARAEKVIADRLPELIDNLFDLAAGVLVQHVGKDGVVDVFERPPDRQANEYLINRIMGKPTERAEVTGPSGGPVEVVTFYLPDNGRDPEPSEIDPTELAAPGTLPVEPR